MLKKEKPKANDYIVGVWWYLLASGSQLTVTVYRDEGCFTYYSSLVNKEGIETYSNTRHLGGTEQENIAEMEERGENEISEGSILKMYRFVCQSDDADIYERIVSVFTGLGIGLFAS